MTELRTIPDLFFNWIHHPAAPALVDGRESAGGTRLPAPLVARRVAGTMAAFRGLGIARGDRVALLSNNRPEWHIVDFALHHLGAVNVSIYTTLLADQVAFILRDSGATAVLVEDADQLAKVLEVRGGLSELRHVILLDGEPPAGVHRFSDLVRDVDEAEAASLLEEGRAAASPGDLATLIYTSGTTGNPKGAMLTHDNFVFNAVASSSLMPWPDEREVALCFLPLSHVLERLVDYIYFLKGVTLTYCGVLELAEALKRVRPTLFTAVPRVYEKIHERILTEVGHAPAVRQAIFRRAMSVAAEARRGGRKGLSYALYDRLVYRKLRDIFGGRLRFSISGGAPLSPHVAEFFQAVGVWVLEGYGLTETSPVIAVNPLSAPRIGTVGKVLDGVEVKIASDGEILTRGRHVMQGYWRNPDATAEAIDAQGWFATGDIGELTGDGYLRITDRKKDLIVTAGGKNVAPQPIEGELSRSPLVESVLLYGDRRPFIVALIVPAFEQLKHWAKAQGIPSDDPAALVADGRVIAKYQEIVDTVNAGLARFETVKKFALLAEPFTMTGGELTPTLKVKRRVVVARYRREIDALYGGPAES